MKDDRYIVGIFQEYCDKVDMQPGGDAAEVTIREKYFNELYTRVLLHGWTCLSKFMDEDFTSEFEFPPDDESDWWKKSK